MSTVELEQKLEQLLQEIRAMKTVARLPTVLTKEDAARELANISIRTLNRMIEEGRIQTCEISDGRVGIPRSEIERLAKLKPAPARAPAGKRAPKAASDGRSEKEKILAALRKPRR